MKRPAFQFYPSDWRSDTALQSCSLPARGLWIECMCLMHESERYGYLQVGGKALTNQKLARLVGEDSANVEALISELEEAGVFSRDENGVIYSRRMVNDERIRNAHANCGKFGGNPNLVNQNKRNDENLVNQTSNQKSEEPKNLVNQKQTKRQPNKEIEVNQTSNQSPTPSSSSSTSTSKPSQVLPVCVPKSRERARDAPPTHMEKLGGSFSMVAGWRPPDSVVENWKATGIAGIDFDERIDEFVGYWQTRPDAMPEDRWEHKLVSQLRYAQNRSKERVNRRQKAIYDPEEAERNKRIAMQMLDEDDKTIEGECHVES
jgi:hypothetical protein